MRVFTNRFWLVSAVIATGLSPAVLAQTPAPLPVVQVVPDATAVSPFTPAAEPVAAPQPIPREPVAVPQPAPAPVIPITVTQTYVEPTYVEPNSDLEVRITALEASLKKKQDKPDSKKAFTKTVSGRVYFDSYNVVDQGGADTGAPANFTGLQNYNGVRDARIGVSGEGYEIFDYTVDLGFTQGTGTANYNNAVNFKDVAFGVKNVPLLEYVRIGHYRVEDGLSHLVGGTNTTFLEFADRDFSLSRRIGISSRQLWAQDRLRLFTGIFFENDFVSNNRFSKQDNQGTITNVRLTYMPYASRGKDGKIDGKCFTLFGGNYSYIDVTKKAGSTSANWRSRFDTLDIDNVFEVNIDTANYQKFGLEFAKQNGPFTLQAEAFFNVYENAKTWSGNNPAVGIDVRHGRTVSGGYIMARYFLTGDFRKFNANNATWGTASLNHNLDLRKICDRNYVCWSGAWELAARWSYVDLTDLWNDGNSSVVGGDINTLTVGLNWYWSPQARWMFDYSHIMPNRIRNGQSRDASTTDLLSIAFRYNF